MWCTCHPGKWPVLKERTLLFARLQGGAPMGEAVAIPHAALDQHKQMAALLLAIPGGPDRIEIRDDCGGLLFESERRAAG